MSDSEPIAWAVLLADGDRIYDVYAIEEDAKAIDAVVTGNHGVVPLYRSPTLTDEEREAVAIMERVANRTENLVVGIGPRHAKSFDGPTIAATLRTLLERTK
jgi:hypothetical protein